MKFSLDEIIKITDAKLVYSTNASGKFGVSTDTRNISPEQIYIPIKGENFDGHNFIEDAIKKSARGFFIEESEIEKLKTLPKAKIALQVKNTREAYLALAGAYREKIAPIVVAITGSSGKTTVKEMIADVLAKKYRVHKTKFNFNNEIGLAQTMFEMPANTEVLVLEMGMRGLGEIELLSRYAKPDIAVITNIGLAHVGRLGSQANIAKAKYEIAEHLHPEGVLVVCEDEFTEKYAKVKNKIVYSLNDKNLKNIQKTPEGVNFDYKKHGYSLKVFGDYNILNALCSIEIGQKLGISSKLIEEALFEYEPHSNRGMVLNVDGLILLADYYNANPESMKASIQAALEAYGEIAIVLGDMAELGDREVFYHREIGRFLRDKNIKYLVTVGDLAKNIAKVSGIKNAKSFDDTKEAVQYLQSIENDVPILLKASRAMKFEEIVDELRGQKV